MKKAIPLTLLGAGLLLATGALARAVKPPKADPDMQKVLDAMAALKPKAIELLTPEQARKQPTPADAVKKLLADMGQSAAPEAGVSVKTVTIGSGDASFPVHIYTPEGAGPDHGPGHGPLPMMVYYHGGGFVIADTAVYDATPRALAKLANAIIVAVDYRRAPEHPFPAAPNDAFLAYQWTVDHARDLNGDPMRVAVGGESAGGNLATVVSLMARDKKVAPPVHQLLVYPVVDDDMNTRSYKRNANAKPLNKAMMAWFFKHYKGDPKNPYALPMKAATLRGLPPATVITAEIDPLLSEGKDYADRLEAEGVPVSYREYKGVTHEFFGMGAVLPKAKEAQQFAADALKKAFASAA